MEYWAAFAVMTAIVIKSLHLMRQEKSELSIFRKISCYILSYILFILNFEVSPSAFRIVINMLLYVFLAYSLFEKSIKSSFFLGVLVFSINIVSEFIYAILSMPLINHNIFINNTSLLVLIQNIIIGVIMLILCYYASRKDIYYKLINKINNIHTKQIIVFSVLSMILYNFLIWITYFVSKSLYNNPLFTLAGSMISLFCAFFIYVYLKTNSSYKEMFEKYNLSLESIKVQEQVIENNRINNHEIRNQFLMLRNMSKNKKINLYIDTILDSKINDDEELLIEVSKIPSGGLRGLIYTKLLTMKEKNINYDLHIEKRINIKKISKIEFYDMIDICKIIGIFLDNAIEAVENLNEKTITIEMFLDKKDIVISITNNFEGYIDIENIDKAGFTTKDNGRGYGLNLVDKIIRQNEKLESFKELYEDNFTQNLKIKM